MKYARVVATAAAATTLGAATVAGFAPLSWPLLPVFTIAALIALWRDSARRRDAALIGFAFGLGYFLTGVSWVYVSLHDFGMMPALLAAVITLVFCGYLALYPALVGCAYRALGPPTLFSTLAVLPALWTLAEWVRGTLFTGFSWLELGYAQIPAAPLAGYVPLFGIHAASYATVLSAALLAEIARPRAAVRRRIACGAACASLWLAGYGLLQIAWTHPAGEPLKVALLQGNIAQDMKWRPEIARATLDTYRELAAQAGDARLVVLPETALPMFLDELPEGYVEALAAQARAQRGDVLAGVPERLDASTYYNSVLSFGAAPTQTYRKSHLVPFGEYIPLKPLFGWFLDLAHIPLADFARGTDQRPLVIAGQQVAVDICYEDAFGAEIIRQLPQATLLVNASNVAWFGRSLAPRQHLQISQARALETGRYMLRATNTGMTAIIDPRGRVVDVAPMFTAAAVRGNVRGYEGATPYVRWGNMPVLLLCGVLALAAVARRARKS